MKFIFENENYIAIDKAPGMHVHPHEDKRHRVPRHQICLYQVRDHLRAHVYPIHRLDAATSGVLIFGKSSKAAAEFQKVIQSKAVAKEYWAIIRGFVPTCGKIDLPLKSDSSEEFLEASTEYQCLKQIEIPLPVGKKFSFARYSWVQVRPITGRFHQIRRHFNRISAPLLGDPYHGDSHHNRFFRETLLIPGLCLRAFKLEFTDPFTNEKMCLQVGLDSKFKLIDDLFSQRGRYAEIKNGIIRAEETKHAEAQNHSEDPKHTAGSEET